MLTGDEQIRLDNARYLAREGSPRKVIGWSMRGSYYRRGRRYPGCTLVYLNGGGYRYYPEDTAIGPALDEMERLGYDVLDAKAKLEHWTRTGEGATFDLR